MKLIALILILFSLPGCSYKASYNPAKKEMTANAKGKYTYKDDSVKMTAEFGKPLIDISPKIDLSDIVD